jgi:REP element-mobilizing transposase RayT
MPRLARIAIANLPHHVTQRGNARQFLLAADSEKTVYFELLAEYLALYEVLLLGYCLMSNHVHLILLPPEVDSLTKPGDRRNVSRSLQNIPTTLRFQISGNVPSVPCIPQGRL